MIQEVKHRFDTNQDQTLPIYKRSNTHSLQVDTPETLAPVHIYRRVGPKFPERAVFTPPAINSEVYSRCIQEYCVWLLARVVGSSGEKQVVTGYVGFISATSAKPSESQPLTISLPSTSPSRSTQLSRSYKSSRKMPPWRWVMSMSSTTLTLVAA